jgi:hypothetical protein
VPTLTRNLAAVAVFTALALFTTFPLVIQLDTVVPGTGPGDNLTSLWSTWAFARAVATGGDVFRTDLLFAPFGTQLSLHTHTMTHSVLAWPWTGVSVAFGHNLAILGGLVLNGYLTFVLAHRLSGMVLPALVAGWLVASSAFVHAHLPGHMNLLHVWVIVLFVLALLRFESAPTVLRGAALGAAGALVVYTDYYFAIYCALIVLIRGAARLITFRRLSASPALRRASTVMFVLAGAALALAIVIVASGGVAVDSGPVRISARTPRNPLNIAWLLFLLGLVCRWPFRPAVVRPPAGTHQLLVHSGVALLVCAVLLAPLLHALTVVIASGEYASPRVLWRSSPPGGDVSTLLLGHPSHVLAGEWTRRTYQQLGIDLVEQSLWLGLVPLLLLAAWHRSWIYEQHARRWLAAGAVFFILALGPFLRIAGIDTGLTLPHAALRYAPGISNARMPGRAVVVVQLATAVLLAIAWSRRRPGTATATVLALLVLLESLPGRTPLYSLPAADDVDRAIAGGPAGAVLELPFGLRDGFGERGAFDHRALVHQSAHGRPLAGGFVARLSPGTVAKYEQDQALSQLLAFSQDDAAPLPSAAALADQGFAYLVLNRDLMDHARLPAGTLLAAGYRLVVADGPRELYTLSR